MKIGIRLESLGLPLRKALQEATRLSVGGVQFDAAGDLAPGQLSQTGRRELKHLLRSYNLEVTAVGCPLRRGLDTMDQLDQRIDQVKAVMALSFDMGPRLTIIQAGKVPGPPVPGEPNPAQTAAMLGLATTGSGLLLAGPESTDLAGLVAGISGTATPAGPTPTVIPEAIAALAEHGDRTGTILALETGLESGDDLGKFLARFDTGGLGANFDPANLLLNGFDPYEGARGLAGRIVHVTARDGRRSSTRRSDGEVALGNGDLEWMRLLGTFEEVGYHSWLTVARDEGDQRPQDVAAGVQFLRRLI